MVGGFFLVAKFIESPTPVASNEKKQGDKTLENQTPASVPLEQTDEAQEGEPLSAANDPVPEVFEAGAKKTNKPVKRGPQERAPKDDSGNRLAMQKLPDPPYMAALQSGGAAVRKPLWEPSQPPQNSSQRLAPEGLSDVDEKANLQGVEDITQAVACESKTGEQQCWRFKRTSRCVVCRDASEDDRNRRAVSNYHFRNLWNSCER